nr:MAG TPA: hypothetical protein [Caudoviricetes sp.]
MSTWLTIVFKVFFTQQSPPDRAGHGAIFHAQRRAN